MAAKVRHGGLGGRERALAELAHVQEGVVGREQLLRIGVSERTIERWLAVGRLHALNRGAYAVGHDRIGQRGRWHAALLACGVGAVLSHTSAAALWGIARERGAVVDVTSPRGNQGLARWPRVRLHRCRIRSDDETTIRSGIQITSVARTLFDLAEAIDYPRLERSWEEADRLRLLRLSAVERVCENGYGRRALKPIRLLLAEARATVTTRSPLEDRFLRFCAANGIPTPATNVAVLGHEVDALWPAARLIAELDSWEFHGHRAAFERDRARDPELLLAGYRTIRVTHRRLTREASALAAEIRDLLAAPPLAPVRLG